MSHPMASSVEMVRPKNIEKRRYQTVIFDVGGTLIGFEEDSPFEEFLAAVSVPHCFESGTDLRLRMLNILSTRRDEAVGLGLDNDGINNWWLTIFNDLFPECPEVARGMWELFKCNYFDSLFPDSLPILQRLKARRMSLGIISNFGTNLFDLLLQFGIAEYFDFVIVSASEGVVKPDPRIFAMGLEAAGVPANQALYIGDNVADDIEGANNVGMDAVLINRPGRQPSTAPMMIDSLLEIESYVFPQLGANIPASRPYESDDSSPAILPPLISPQYSMTV